MKKFFVLFMAMSILSTAHFANAKESAGNKVTVLAKKKSDGKKEQKKKQKVKGKKKNPKK